MELSEYSWHSWVTSEGLWHFPGSEVTPGFLTRLICCSCLFSTSLRYFMENLYLSRVSSRKRGKSIKIISKGKIDSPLGMAWIGGKMEPGFEEWKREKCRWCLRLVMLVTEPKNNSLGFLSSSSQQFSTPSFPLSEENWSYLHTSQVVLSNFFLAGGPCFIHYSFPLGCLFSTSLLHHVFCLKTRWHPPILKEPSSIL